jgi:hypothetical protein
MNMKKREVRYWITTRSDGAVFIYKWTKHFGGMYRLLSRPNEWVIGNKRLWELDQQDHFIEISDAQYALLMI